MSTFSQFFDDGSQIPGPRGVWSDEGPKTLTPSRINTQMTIDADEMTRSPPRGDETPKKSPFLCQIPTFQSVLSMRPKNAPYSTTDQAPMR